MKSKPFEVQGCWEGGCWMCRVPPVGFFEGRARPWCGEKQITRMGFGDFGFCGDFLLESSG